MEGSGQALGHKYTTRLNGEPGSCESREKIRITRSLMSDGRELPGSSQGARCAARSDFCQCGKEVLTPCGPFW
jgi:hypothetical protein